ncbi:hypothetical protein K2Y11_23765 [bacterium]|nr:hypothetical protein [bacterium]
MRDISNRCFLAGSWFDGADLETRAEIETTSCGTFHAVLARGIGESVSDFARMVCLARRTSQKSARAAMADHAGINGLTIQRTM